MFLVADVSMKVLVSYNKYNSEIEKATVQIDEDQNFELEVVEDVAVSPSEKKLQIKANNTLTQEEIALELTFAESKEFTMLINQFLKTLA